MMACTSRSTRRSPSRGARCDRRSTIACSRPTSRTGIDAVDLAPLHGLDHGGTVFQHLEHGVVDRVDDRPAARHGVEHRGPGHRAERERRRHDPRQLGRGDRLRGVAHRSRGIRVALDEQGIRAGRHRGHRERRHPARVPRRMTRVDRDGEIGHLAEHGDRADVEGVAGRGLEGSDPTLAEDDLGIALTGDVVRRRKPLVVGGRHAALEDHRHPALPRCAQQRCVVHRAGSDQQRVHVPSQQGDVVGGKRLSDHRKPGDAPGLVEQRQPRVAEPLERSGTGSRLEDASAERGRSGTVGGDGMVDVVGFDCAWPGDHGHRVTADDDVADADTARVVTMGCAREQRLDGHRIDPPCGDGPPHGISGADPSSDEPALVRTASG